MDVKGLQELYDCWREYDAKASRRKWEKIMTEPVDNVAQAIYEARFLHEPTTWRRKWEDLDELTRDIWRRCAQAAKQVIREKSSEKNHE